MAYLFFYALFTSVAIMLLFRLVYQLAYEPVVLFFQSYFSK